jgi:hypothetical protein
MVSIGAHCQIFLNEEGLRKKVLAICIIINNSDEQFGLVCTMD